MTDEGPGPTLAPDPDSSEALGTAAAPTPVVEPGARLDRQKILAAAVALIDTEGLRAFTMRSLGARLGVEAMALYRYVYGREALLDGIVEYVIDDLYGDPEVHLAKSNWQDYLVQVAHGVRRVALAHPEVFPLIATRPPAAPWVRPPLRSLRWMESFLGTLQNCGFDDASAVRAYRAFSSFLLGYLLLEVSALGADTSPIEQAPPEVDTPTALAGYPLLQRLEPELSENHSAEEFEDALDTLVQRLNSRP